MFEGNVETGGASVDDHFKRLARADPSHLNDQGIKITRAPGAPTEIVYLLAWYNEIRAQNVRNWHFEPIPFTEIMAYSAAYDLEIKSWEVEVICILDGIWRSKVPKPSKPPQE